MRRVDMMKKSDRESKILHLLQDNETVSLKDLTRTLDVSVSTVRRDLDELVEARLVRRKSGRAEIIAPPGEEIPFTLRAMVNEDEKRRIARAALDLVQNGETIYISSGSTALEFARLLPGQRRLTVITNALRVANALVDIQGIDLIVLGGAVRPNEQTMHGHLTEWGAQQFRADKMVYGIQAISLQHGLTHSQVVEVNTDRVIARSVNQVIVLVDHSKFGKVAPVLVLPISETHVVVTGREVSQEVVDGLGAAHIQVILA